MNCKNYKLLYRPGPVSRGEPTFQVLVDHCSCMRASGLCGLHLLESSSVQLGAKASVRHSEWMPFMSCTEHARWGTWSLYTVLVPPVKAFSQEDSCAFLTAFHFTQSQNVLFSISICGVATHHLLLQTWLRACHWTGSLHFCFEPSLLIPSVQFFSSSMQSAFFPPQKRNETSALTAMSSRGEHRDLYSEKD